MQMRQNFFWAILFLFLISNAVLPCTTAIISGKATPDGRPLLWKHRDSDHLQNVLRYFNDGRYPYIGLVNADDTLGTQVWAGYNQAGFAIMNSASYNLKPNDDSTSLQDQEGVLMKLALQTCRTLSDFEHLLDSLPKPLGVESNFGVIDAQGGAAYYETNNFTYKKLDVNDPAIAPNGYLIHTNFSFTGRLNQGFGYIRYQEAQKLFEQAMAGNALTAEFLLQKVSRSLEHGLTGRNLYKESPEALTSHLICFRDYIPRYSTASVMVVQGIKKGKNPQNTVAWVILGFPLTSIAYPIWVAAGPNFPEFLQADAQKTAPLCRAALQLKESCFPVRRGSGHSYLNLTALLNTNGTGILQRILPFEKQIIDLSNAQIEALAGRTFDRRKAQSFYQKTTKMVETFYLKEWQIDLRKNKK